MKRRQGTVSKTVSPPSILRIPHGASLLDLVFTDEPNMIDKVEVLGKVGRSDHNVLFWTSDIMLGPSVATRRMRDYNKGNYTALGNELRKTNWEEVLQGTTSEAWSVFKQQLLDLVDTYVPYKKVHVNKRRKAIWMTHKALRLVKKKHAVYTKYKDTHHPAYRKAARAASKAVREAKKNFEFKLAANIKNDTKSFYAYVNSRCKSKVRVGPLVADNGNIVADAEDMSEQLNEYFTSVFTAENLSSIPSTDTASC